jgi:hypothetical protein
LRLALSHNYRWRRCDNSGTNCAFVVGATNQTYVLTRGEADRARAREEAPGGLERGSATHSRLEPLGQPCLKGDRGVKVQRTAHVQSSGQPPGAVEPVAVDRERPHDGQADIREKALGRHEAQAAVDRHAIGKSLQCGMTSETCLSRPVTSLVRARPLTLRVALANSGSLTWTLPLWRLQSITYTPDGAKAIMSMLPRIIGARRSSSMGTRGHRFARQRASISSP